ncbi:hypothetical protein FOL47_007490 [Perkinsus chesapeaki]|uniref:Uncharacterized protein n=1 Tax=Perkinsus chesapeaki TaxID=330153 RepID=A0A7J6LK41_PERCH|nr:hypothetical protein FOL47_007490 [Perkinsus chesapeaki]
MTLMRITTILGLLICCEAYLDLTFTPETGQYSQFINRIEFQNDGKVNFFRQVDSDSPATVYTCVYVDKDVGDGIAIDVQGVLCTTMIKDSNGLLDGKFLTMKATYDKTYLVAQLPKGATFYVYVWPQTCYLSTDGRFVDYIYSIIVTERRARLVRQKDEISPKILYTCDSTTTIVSGGLEVKLSGIQCRKMIQDSEGQLDDNFLTLDIDLDKEVLTTKLPEGIAKWCLQQSPIPNRWRTYRTYESKLHTHFITAQGLDILTPYTAGPFEFNHHK